MESNEAEILKLNEIEKEFVELISKTDNEVLQEKFLQWSNQRIACNQSYVDSLENLFEDQKSILIKQGKRVAKAQKEGKLTITSNSGHTIKVPKS
jgi:hypothetical protein